MFENLLIPLDIWVVVVLEWFEMAFFGEYEVALTDGGRLVLPKKIRENLKGSTFIVTKGFDICLGGYDKQDWDVRSEELMHVSLVDTTNIQRRRFLFAGANEISVDEQGRFVVPKALVEFARLAGKSITIIGAGDHFEIWETNTWKTYLKTIET